MCACAWNDVAASVAIAHRINANYIFYYLIHILSLISCNLNTLEGVVWCFGFFSFIYYCHHSSNIATVVVIVSTAGNVSSISLRSLVQIHIDSGCFLFNAYFASLLNRLFFSTFSFSFIGFCLLCCRFVSSLFVCRHSLVHSLGLSVYACLCLFSASNQKQLHIKKNIWKWRRGVNISLILLFIQKSKAFYLFYRKKFAVFFSVACSFSHMNLEKNLTFSTVKCTYLIE